MVDEELPFGREGGRKSWYLTVTQDEDLLETLGPVHGAPKDGKTLLLFEDDVVALVQHLMMESLLVIDAEGERVLNSHAHDWDNNSLKKQFRELKNRELKKKRARRIKERKQ